MNEEFIVPDRVYTQKGIDNLYTKAVLQELNKLHSHIFENPDTQFHILMKKINKLLDEFYITDSDLYKEVKDFSDKLTNIFNKFTTIELQMLLLKNEFLEIQHKFENQDQDVA